MNWTRKEVIFLITLIYCFAFIAYIADWKYIIQNIRLSKAIALKVRTLPEEKCVIEKLDPWDKTIVEFFTNETINHSSPKIPVVSTAIQLIHYYKQICKK
jgi:hypothetical protein